MRHATPADLERVAELLAELRAVAGLVERSPGVFSRRSRAFLHFHADPAGLFADVRLDGEDFTRLPATTRAEQARLVARVRAVAVERREA